MSCKLQCIFEHMKYGSIKTLTRSFALKPASNKYCIELIVWSVMYMYVCGGLYDLFVSPNNVAVRMKYLINVLLKNSWRF